MRINEIMGLCCNTRKRLQALDRHGKIDRQLVFTSIAEGGKHDRHGIRTSHSGGSSPKAQAFKIHSDTTYPYWTTGICQAWQPLQGNTRGTTAVHNPEYQAKRPIKKATVVWWQMTTKFSTFRASHRSTKLMRDGPRFSVPTLSIANDAKQVNGYTRWHNKEGVLMNNEQFNHPVLDDLCRTLDDIAALVR